MHQSSVVSLERLQSSGVPKERKHKETGLVKELARECHHAMSQDDLETTVPELLGKLLPDELWNHSGPFTLSFILGCNELRTGHAGN